MLLLIGYHPGLIKDQRQSQTQTPKQQRLIRLRYEIQLLRYRQEQLMKYLIASVVKRSVRLLPDLFQFDNSIASYQGIIPSFPS